MRLGLRIGTEEQDSLRNVFWKTHLETAESKFGGMDEPSSHVWKCTGLEPSRRIKHGGGTFNTDRVVYIPVTRACTGKKCTWTERVTLVYPILLISDSWTDVAGIRHDVSGIEDWLQRVLLQQSAMATGKCEGCRTGKFMTSKDTLGILLPTLLQLEYPASQFTCRLEQLDIAHSIEVCKGWSYELVGVALHTPGHYTCNFKIGDQWVYYNDIPGLNGKPTCKRVRNGNYRPPKFSRRLLYYVHNTELRSPVTKGTHGGLSNGGGVEEQVGVEMEFE